jgi:serine/threonine protein kinase
MAETFLAVQRAAAGFEQRVCMKFILPGHRGNADFRRLFLREASIAASLRHSNIVGVIDVDAAAGYMVLELVDGVDLRTLLNAAPNHKLSPEIATLVIIELCKALAYAHGRVRRGQPDGIVHRDVSPSNVLVSYAGEVKLTDFGVARAMRADVEPLSTTV